MLHRKNHPKEILLMTNQLPETKKEKIDLGINMDDDNRYAMDMSKKQIGSRSLSQSNLINCFSLII